VAVFAAVLIGCWLAAIALTPVTIRFAHRYGLLDYPTERKAHKKAVPVIGGFAVFLSMVTGLALVAPFFPVIRELAWGYGSLGVLALGAVLMNALGLWDDLYDMYWHHKLVGQLAIGALTWFLGFQAGPVELPFGFELTDAAPISFLITVAWIVVISNAFNLIDGMDGLSAGVALITVLTVFLLANQYGATVSVVATLALAGALAGFLRFNLPPARLFLGDAGALSIGYLVAVLSLASYQKAPTAVALIVPLVVVGLPVLDIVVAVIRRGLSHLSAQGAKGLSVRELISAVTRADRGHLHHLLLRNGFSVSASLVILYLVCIALASVGFQTRGVDSEFRFALFGGLIASGYACVRVLERRALRLEADAARAAEAASPELAQARNRAAG